MVFISLVRLQDTFEIYCIQFLRLDGRTRPIIGRLPIGYKELYDDMIASGYEFHMEQLTTGEISSTISNHSSDISIRVTPNGPEVIQALQEMLEERRWEIA